MREIGQMHWQMQAGGSRDGRVGCQLDLTRRSHARIKEAPEWKELGLGAFKTLQSEQEGVRVRLMQREQSYLEGVSC